MVTSWVFGKATISCYSPSSFHTLKLGFDDFLDMNTLTLPCSNFSAEAKSLKCSLQIGRYTRRLKVQPSKASSCHSQGLIDEMREGDSKSLM
jgi:hypothetical protein